MSTALELKITEQQYLEQQRTAEIKYQFIDGDMYAMAGGSEEHNVICINVTAELRQKLKGGPCKPFMADMMIKAGANYFYPDVMIVCEPDERDDRYLKHAPTIIVEVLSNSTRKIDLTLKKLAYMNLPSLQEYVLVEQDKCEVEVFRRSQNWASSYYLLGDDIHFESVDVTLSVEDIYESIVNDDVNKFLESL